MRSRHLSTIAALSVVLLSPTALGAQAKWPAPQLVSPGNALRAPANPSPENPFRKLFQVPPPGAPAQLAPSALDAPRVVCGMTVIPADPSIDPGIAARRADESTRFTIRAIEPKICR